MLHFIQFTSESSLLHYHIWEHLYLMIWWCITIIINIIINFLTNVYTWPRSYIFNLINLSQPISQDSSSSEEIMKELLLQLNLLSHFSLCGFRMLHKFWSLLLHRYLMGIISISLLKSLSGTLKFTKKSFSVPFPFSDY